MVARMYSSGETLVMIIWVSKMMKPVKIKSDFETYILIDFNKTKTYTKITMLRRRPLQFERFLLQRKQT